MKIRIKVVCTFLTLSKKPPPFSKSWLRACISPLKFHTLCSSTEPYLCQNCYSELFPFQTLDDKQLLNEMRNDDKLNFDTNHTNNSFFPAKCLQADNKIKSLLNDLNSGLVDSKYCSEPKPILFTKSVNFLCFA